MTTTVSTNLSLTDDLPESFEKTVVLMDGFGSNHEFVALYLDGHLMASQEVRDIGEDARSDLVGEDDRGSLHERLARRFVRVAGYDWLERRACAVWQERSYIEPPAKLQDYRTQTLEMLTGFSEASVVENYGGCYPMRDSNELWALSRVYGLSGGDPLHEDVWLASFLEAQGGSFVTLHEALYDIVLLGVGQPQGSPKSVASDGAFSQLKALYAARVKAAWAAEKPMTELGALARAKSGL